MAKKPDPVYLKTRYLVKVHTAYRTGDVFVTDCGIAVPPDLGMSGYVETDESDPNVRCGNCQALRFSDLVWEKE